MFDQTAVRMINLSKDAVKKYGHAHQKGIAEEEMAELTVAIKHHNRDKASNIDVLTEIADVEIQLQQLKIIYGNPQLYEVVLNKQLDKLETYLKS